MRRFRFIFIALFCLTEVASAQPDISEIENYIENAGVAWDVPGLAVAIVKDGRIVSNKGYGVLEAGKKDKVDENTLFAIASNTKAFISTSIGILQSEGRLHLDDKVADYIPGFQMYDPYVSGEATIADLLCHRIGLGTYSGDVIWYKSTLSAVEVVRKVRYVPQAFGFRDGYGYSNLMFITAGEVIRAASGMSWDKYVQQKILTPIGMNRTITSVNALEKTGNFATPHKPVKGENVPIDWVNWDNMGAAGGIISSTSDMAKWLIFQLNNGILENDTILPPKIQNILRTPHNNFVVSLKEHRGDPVTNFAGYGLGWRLSDYDGHRLILHGGGYDGMYSQVAMMPEQNLGIVILTNTMKGIATPLRKYICDAYLGRESRDWSAEALAKTKKESSMQRRIRLQKEARVANTTPSIDPEKCAGNYYADMVGGIRIAKTDKGLRLMFDNAPDLSATLTHWHYDTWQIKWDKTHAWFDFGTITFLHDNEMNVAGLAFDVPNNDIFFDELKVYRVD